jgi:hypothetical protein
MSTSIPLQLMDDHFSTFFQNKNVLTSHNYLLLRTPNCICARTFTGSISLKGEKPSSLAMRSRGVEIMAILRRMCRNRRSCKGISSGRPCARPSQAIAMLMRMRMEEGLPQRSIRADSIDMPYLCRYGRSSPTLRHHHGRRFWEVFGTVAW